MRDPLLRALFEKFILDHQEEIMKEVNPKCLTCLRRYSCSTLQTALKDIAKVLIEIVGENN